MTRLIVHTAMLPVTALLYLALIATDVGPAWWHVTCIAVAIVLQWVMEVVLRRHIDALQELADEQAKGLDLDKKLMDGYRQLIARHIARPNQETNP